MSQNLTVLKFFNLLCALNGYDFLDSVVSTNNLARTTILDEINKSYVENSIPFDMIASKSSELSVIDEIRRKRLGKFSTTFDCQLSDFTMQ